MSLVLFVLNCIIFYALVEHDTILASLKLVKTVFEKNTPKREVQQRCECQQKSVQFRNI